jgi:hypothetical protein
MQLLLASAPALSVGRLFCPYRVYRQALRRREQHRRRLHERVAYLLWVAADVDGRGAGTSSWNLRT